MSYDSSYAPPPPPLIPSDARLSALQTSKLIVDKGSVTQITSTTTGVTLNFSTGKVTTVASVLAAETEESFTLHCSSIAANSVVIVKVSGYGGSQGLPNVRVNAVTEGSCSIVMQNGHNSDALDGTMIIGFLVV